MATYMLHVGSHPDALMKAVVVKDGFSWGAFIFTFLWFFYQKLWLLGFVILALYVAFGVGLDALGFGTGNLLLIEMILSFLIGFEAFHLQSWYLQRKGMPLVDVVQARSLDEAETLGFSRFIENSSSDHSPPANIPLAASGQIWPSTSSAPFITPVTSSGTESVIGLFPDKETR